MKISKLVFVPMLALLVFGCDVDSTSSTSEVTTASDDATTGDTTTGDTTTGDTTTVTEDFESYAQGATISDANALWQTNHIDTGSVAVTTNAQTADGSSVALLISDKATDGKPFVYRNFTAGAAASGSVSMDVYVPSSNKKTSYINVGSGTSNSDRYFEVRLSSKIGYESGSDDMSFDNDVSGYTRDAWHSLTIAWAAGFVTLSVDGIAIATDIDQTTLGLDAAAGSPTQLTMYAGDTSNVDTELYIDNVNSTLLDE